MAGVKGQRNPSKHKRQNQWTAGSAEATREPEVFAFKIRKDFYSLVKADLEERGISKQQLCDELIACYYGEDQGDEVPEIGINHPLVQDAIQIAIAQKQAALRAELKSKRPNQALIEKWQKDIEDLELLLG